MDYSIQTSLHGVARAKRLGQELYCTCWPHVVLLLYSVQVFNFALFWKKILPTNLSQVAPFLRDVRSCPAAKESRNLTLKIFRSPSSSKTRTIYDQYDNKTYRQRPHDGYPQSVLISSIGKQLNSLDPFFLLQNAASLVGPDVEPRLRDTLETR